MLMAHKSDESTVNTDGGNCMENRCVICGKIIPEGRQICPNCENGQLPKREQDEEQDD